MQNFWPAAKTAKHSRIRVPISRVLLLFEHAQLA